MELYVKECGPSAAETIVFLHGGGGGSWMWQPQMDQLKEFHCLAPDLPEHGRSMAVKPFTMQDAASRVIDLIRSRVPGGKAHLVGLSLGAQLTVEILSQSPEVVDHAVVSSAILRPMPGANLGFYSRAVLLAAYWSSIAPFKNWDAWIRLNMKSAAGIPDRYYPQFKADFQAQTPDSWANVLQANMAFRLPPGLEKVQNPVLVIAGQQEYQAMRQSAEDLLAVLPNARGVRVTHPEKWSLAEEHNWSMKAPDLFSEMVRAWLTGCPLPAELAPIQ